MKGATIPDITGRGKSHGRPVVPGILNAPWKLNSDRNEELSRLMLN